MTDIIAEPFDWNDNLSEEAIEDFEAIRKDLPYCTCQNIGMALAKLELLEKQGQKLKTGHWIYDRNIENWRCSECGETPKTLGYCGTADFMAEHFKHCNHCGIRMVEPQEGGNQE